MREKKVDMDKIKKLLKDKSLAQLNLSHNHICDEGAKYLADFLKENRTLTQLYLYNNNIGVEGAKYIAESLKINNTLTQLDLFNNNIGVEGAKWIAEFIKINSTLTQLYLSGNNIGIEGAKWINDKVGKNKKYQLMIKNYIKKFLHLTGVLTNKHIRLHMYKNLLRQVILTNVISSIDLNQKNRKYLLKYI